MFSNDIWVNLHFFGVFFVLTDSATCDCGLFGLVLFTRLATLALSCKVNNALLAVCTVTE